MEKFLQAMDDLQIRKWAKLGRFKIKPEEVKGMLARATLIGLQ